MKCLGILFTAITICFAANAQSPAPEPDTIQDPVKQTDPAVKISPKEENYTEDRIKVTPEQVPVAVRQALGKKEEYEGLEKAKFYKNKGGTVYTIELTRLDTTRTFRFDQHGKEITE